MTEHIKIQRENFSVSLGEEYYKIPRGGSENFQERRKDTDPFIHKEVVLRGRNSCPQYNV